MALEASEHLYCVLKACHCVWVLCNRPTLPDADAVLESDSFDIPDGQTLMSRLQWEDSPDISPTDSASSKASKEGTLSTLLFFLWYTLQTADE